MRIIPDSELIINSDGSVFHLHLKPEQLSDKIIMMGDPDRVSLTASFFDSVEAKPLEDEYKKRYSINTILTSFISRDLQFQGIGNPTLNSEYLKIRLIGNKEWLYPDIDFLNKKI